MAQTLPYYFGVLLFNLCLAFYLITALQWYSYKLSRLIFHYHRPLWHVYFLALPCVVFLTALGFSWLALAYFVLIHAPLLYFWNKKLDKKLIFTPKVRWFFIFVCLYALCFAILSLEFSFLFNLLTLPLALLSLKILDLFQALHFKKKAKNKLHPDLKIILITASFGKTSIKNFLYELLCEDFKTQKSPRSVNTLMGIVKDINENLSPQTQIYIAEAGARASGDILELSAFLGPQFCIVGEIGNAHLEYFKSVENTRATKLKALNSKNLQRAFLHSSTLKNEDDKTEIYDKGLLRVRASLEGLEFSLLLEGEEEHFSSPILGAFNAENLCAAILCAKFLGVRLDKIRQKIQGLRPVEHRLQVLSRAPKFIIDDGFNGNLKGMSQSYALCKSYQGRKILVTPGIIETHEADNIALAQSINESFDCAIITAQTNAALFKRELKIKTLILKDKAELIPALKRHTKNGDLILFSNDAPSFM